MKLRPLGETAGGAVRPVGATVNWLGGLLGDPNGQWGGGTGGQHVLIPAGRGSRNAG